MSGKVYAVAHFELFQRYGNVVFHATLEDSRHQLFELFLCTGPDDGVVHDLNSVWEAGDDDI